MSTKFVLLVGLPPLMGKYEFHGPVESRDKALEIGEKLQSRSDAPPVQIWELVPVEEDPPVNQPVEGFDYWDHHPVHSIFDWQYEVANGDTRQGYWEWVRGRMMRDKATE